ncbi:LacI family DNA-binding transcriptional regulator [Clostridium boliviensis]|uniref:LacI family DNA-binding transcriptional regulator n=1 Tax=Clostridium boliviensis TaxID=318465 RepID=A0ABU4GPI3_9CLOT|nr:LacI family DNA-binding transcriptional regulator [Clostridium boliviensis]MDW2798885.1 LacI family DNA-binding transcriptional regulator [Clostridium boliviensis]
MQSIRDVAKRAGVSISTVSRILNNSANVSDEKIAAVKEALNYYHYEPNQFGRGLVKQKSNMIGVYFPFSSHSIFETSYNLELLKGIEQTLPHYNYNMVIISESEIYESQEESGPRFLESAGQRKIDGLILTGLINKQASELALKRLIDQQYPVIYIGKKLHQRGMNIYAQFENYTINMMHELYNKGHRCVLLYYMHLHQTYIEKISVQLKTELPELKIIPSAFKNIAKSREMIASQIKKYVRDGSCTAVCSPSIELLQLIMGICVELRLSIPDDISILSVEHKKGDGALMYPPISAFYVPAIDMGREAACLVLNMINHENNEIISEEFVTEYIERESIKRLI